MGAGLSACSIPEMKLHAESSPQSELYNASKSSWMTFSATSRRGALMSRRQIVIPLPRRDMEFSRRNVIWSGSPPRRDVAPHVATLFCLALCHVATLPRTSRRRQVKLSITSQRDPTRCDVALFLAQEWLIWPFTSRILTRQNPSFSATHSSPDLSETTFHRSETPHLLGDHCKSPSLDGFGL